MKIRIKVTKDIYRQAMMCGVRTEEGISVPTNCAIALAVRDIAPYAAVFSDTKDESINQVHYIDWTWGEWIKKETLEDLDNVPFSCLPPEVSRRIQDFDALAKYPAKRLTLGEFSFVVDFPDELVSGINIDDVFSKSQTLELV